MHNRYLLIIRDILSIAVCFIIASSPCFASTISYKDIDYSNDNNIDNNDPLEKINRFTYAFNVQMYEFLLTPGANAYNTLVPSWGRQRVYNILENLKTPLSIVNNILQLNFRGAFYESRAFLLNSSIGVAGMFDIASQAKMERSTKYFSETMSKYGLKGSGPYIVLPILGPSSAREATALGLDLMLDPWGYICKTSYITTKNFAIAGITYSEKEHAISAVRRSALDEYATMRNLYFQRHKHESRKKL